jgi:hypothetical protein
MLQLHSRTLFSGCIARPRGGRLPRYAPQQSVVISKVRLIFQADLTRHSAWVVKSIKSECNSTNLRYGSVCDDAMPSAHQQATTAALDS